MFDFLYDALGEAILPSHGGYSYSDYSEDYAILKAMSQSAKPNKPRPCYACGEHVPQGQGKFYSNDPDKNIFHGRCIKAYEKGFNDATRYLNNVAPQNKKE